MARHTVFELAELLGVTLEGDGAHVIEGAASLVDAGPGDVSFLVDPRYRPDFEASRAGAAIVPLDFEAPDRSPRDPLPLLRSSEPSRTFTEAVRVFAPVPPALPAGVHPTAVIEEGAELADDVGVGPFVYVGAGARLGAGVRLHPGVCVGAGARIGAGTEIQARAVVYPYVILGERCVLHAGVVVGSDGFGFERDAQGWSKVLQGGNVVVEDDVEIGANSTVDRARVGVTRIARGCKLDNMVHVGHNVHIGERTLLAAQSGISGSTRLGHDCMLGGQVGLAGHLTLGNGVQVAGKAAVFDDQEDGSKVGGWPARSFREFVRVGKNMKYLIDLPARLRELNARLERLEQNDGPRT